MGAIAPSSGLEFKVSLDVRRDQQPHHDTRIEAHLRVKAAGTGPHDEVPAVELAVVIALDVAAGRRESAAAALAATLRALPDGVSFAVLGGADESGEPSRCYPLRGRWALADTMEKRRAAFSAGRIVPAADDRPPPGYPAWLTAARALFAERPLPLRHLLLITDGSGRDPADEAGPDGDGGALGDELATCDGVFTADVLAVGGDWDPAPLLAVVERLHGTAEHAPDRFGPAVTGALRRLRRVRSPELPVVVTARPAVRAVELTETAPRQQRLTPATGQGEPYRVRFPTHQWEPGTRDYLLTVHADASTDPLGVLLQLATVSVGDATAPLLVRWLPPGVAVGAGATGGGGGTLQAMNAATQMRTALNRGYAALDPMSRDEAEQQFGLAVRLATEIGAAWVLQDVREVADILDGPRGLVRVGPTVDRGTVRRGQLHVASGHGLELPGHTTGKPVKCPHCRHLAGPRARFCIACGRSL
ncbi:zinc ribbon domain-containing protein [Streptomyces sp. NBC_00385]|uniref:zinc ribbon domain-containing protein n=1 Tax=Streptomyces sp. NBC_00385 TaxID=2975733 RepID=UPI002DDA6299|nr:zinc ribbon domain-containing protein [Streptomyces sp. NBC_00385]WRZ03455.1 zinc ribbon domain-containing protein [Streptomyces sp. NBC_00385]